MPHLDGLRLAVEALRTPEPRAGGQRQLRYLALPLVTASTAFNENGFSATSHGRRLLRAAASTASASRRYCMTAAERDYGAIAPCSSGFMMPSQASASWLSRHCFTVSLTRSS